MDAKQKQSLTRMQEEIDLYVPVIQLLEQEPDRSMTDERTGETVALEHIPYIVIVIDEIADLMTVASVEVEEAVMRLAGGVKYHPPGWVSIFKNTENMLGPTWISLNR